MRICISPRWGANPDDDWYPWFKRAIDGHDVIVAPLRPSARTPAIEASVDELRSRLGTDPTALAQTIVVGHSVGCQAILHFLASLPVPARVAGVVCAAAWWSLDQARPDLVEWIGAPIDLLHVRDRSDRFEVLLSDNDPLSADYARNRSVWQQRIGADVKIISGAGHFKRVREPAVLAAVRAMLR